MPAGKNRRLAGQPEALERGAKFFAAAWTQNGVSGRMTAPIIGCRDRSSPNTCRAPEQKQGAFSPSGCGGVRQDLHHEA
jgi:hypothetical protein